MSVLQEESSHLSQKIFWKKAEPCAALHLMSSFIWNIPLSMKKKEMCIRDRYKEEFSAEKWEDFAREEFIICKDSSHGDLPKAERDHFKNLISKKTLKESWQLGKERKYDVGIYGPWMSSNYGSILTYYALCRTVASFGYDVLMIEKGKERYVQRKEAYTASRRFAYQNYTAISPVYEMCIRDRDSAILRNAVPDRRTFKQHKGKRIFDYSRF